MGHSCCLPTTVATAVYPVNPQHDLPRAVNNCCGMSPEKSRLNRDACLDFRCDSYSLGAVGGKTGLIIARVNLSTALLVLQYNTVLK